MYSFFEDKNDKINEFSSINKEGHIFQTSNWMTFKNDWSSIGFIGEDKDNKTVLSCCLLTRKIPYTNKKIGYIPRGFVCDYTNKNLITEFLKFLREYARNNGISFITMDPEIHLNENGQANEFGVEIENMFLDLGLKNLSKGSKNFETIQPNFTFKLDISAKEGEDIQATKDRVFKSFHNKCRYKIKIGSERNLSVEVYDKNNISDEQFDIFQNLMDTTGERDDFIVRKKDYFKSIMEALYPYAEMYLIKYDVSKDKENTLKKIEMLSTQKKPLEEKIALFEEEISNLKSVETTVDIEKKIKKCESKMTTSSNKLTAINNQLSGLSEKMERLKNATEESVYLSGAIYLHFGDKGWYLYGASSNDFRDTMPNFTMQWAMIQRSIELGKDIYDFWGAPGDTSEDNHLHGLYKFKKSFGGDFVELIGEYDLLSGKPMDSLVYTGFKKAFPKFKKIRASLRKK